MAKSLRPLSYSHRLLSPRVAYLIGARSATASNIIPISNVTSISTDPELIGVGVYREWSFVEVLRASSGFTISLPSVEQLDLTWKLGASYSHYRGNGSGGKLQEFEAELDQTWSDVGPVLRDCIGRLECTIADVLPTTGDHVWFIGSPVKLELDESIFDDSGMPKTEFQPVMQVIGNWMTTASHFMTVDYFR